MQKLYLSLSRGHCLLEMPTGTGKTVSLLSLITSYQYSNPEIGKLIYCTRTVQEMDKVIEELKFIMKYRIHYLTKLAEEQKVKIRDPNILGVCLSSRRNLCIHPTV
jgi:DNA excision repair protein ERCC-2